MSDAGWLASHFGAESESHWYLQSFEPEDAPGLSSIRIEDIHLDDEGRWVMHVSGDLRDAQALAEGLFRDGWRYEEGKWIEP